MKQLLIKLADNRGGDSLAMRMRRRRFAHLLTLLDQLPRPVRILDVGGTANYWTTMWGEIPEGIEITLVNLSGETGAAEPIDNVEAVTGDARDLAKFADDDFDLVFSNSVIEHVGDRTDQARMASEVRRVGQRYVVQTPNRWFPLEPHFLFPFFQFLPERVRVALVRRRALGWEPRIEDPAAARAHVRSIQLLSARDVRRAFPGATVRRERVFGLTKSLTAIGGFDLPLR